MRRGDLYWVKLDPIEGSEIGKTRPAVVISNNINNEFADTVTVLPVTSSVGKVYPFEVFLKKGIANISGDSKVKANQIRTVDKKRLKERIGTIPDAILRDIEKAVNIHIELK
ncbi:MAG: type II toxin-antitoxin system PemK/MazF family toxin [Euryarchaeota archaeon]|nr:type II toxin-antitoxin system PemK/MazF family toxin [Euryarchaeota archaeon]MBU4075809.1 type II toxin-antitoxin system PemK/MazF family toxin [Euryarchaeota archaeon]MBU4139087.1 type II toxin-antitoxin system PemK/MazF family toxin [Euryarchaeota archaeon]